MKTVGVRIVLAMVMTVFMAGSGLIALAENIKPYGSKIDLNWQFGPKDIELKDGLAKVSVPEGYAFIDKADTQKLMEAMQNQKTDRELGLIAPAIEMPDWFVIYEYTDSGYVKDDEGDKIDADALIKSMKEGTEARNKENPKLAPFHVVGWQEAPHYDKATHNLTWSVLLKDDKSEFVNYETRLLGRKGITAVTLVADASQLAAIKPELSRIIDGYDYQTGNKYAEFRQGDKVAEVGLSALVAGGLGVAAVKTGFFAKFILPILLAAKKFVILIFVGIAAAFKKIKRALFGGGEDENP